MSNGSEEQEKPKIQKTPQFTTTGRVRDDVPMPAATPLDKIWDDNGDPLVEALTKHFIAEGRLHKKHVLEIINKAMRVFRAEPNMVELSPPVSVCGDIHGQFYDLMELFNVCGNPRETSYLFLGDYVDRGLFGCEVLLIMFSWKLLRGEHFTMLRGNHECRHLTEYFNFKEEVLFKYDEEVYDAFCNAFDCLPLAALMNKRFLCVHGGISPELEYLDDFETIDRFMEPPAYGLMCDILWSDPHPDYNDKESLEWLDNTNRGCSYHFGFQAVTKFLHRNDLFCLIRGHEVQYPGFSMYKQDPKSQFPSVITMFSAPNYCDDHGNKAAVLEYGLNNVMNIKQFAAVEHPYYLPDFSNCFKWSIPFVAEKVADFIQTLYCMEMEELESEIKDAPDDTSLMEQQEVIRMKVRAMGKMAAMFSTLRENSEQITKLKGLTGDNKLPKGLLLRGPTAIQASLEFFERSREKHREDEMMPLKPYEEELDMSDDGNSEHTLSLLRSSHSKLKGGADMSLFRQTVG